MAYSALHALFLVAYRLPMVRNNLSAEHAVMLGLPSEMWVPACPCPSARPPAAPSVGTTLRCTEDASYWQ